MQQHTCVNGGAVRKTTDSYKKKNVEYVMKHYRWNRIVKEFLRIEPSVFT
jgi:hypothetical protein